MTETAYISGPMRGLPNFNHEQFCDVEAEWAARHPNDQIFNPALNFGGDKTLDLATYMDADLRQVLNSTLLVMLPDWWNSEGARLEAQVALITDKRFYYAVQSGGCWEFEKLTRWQVESDLDNGVADNSDVTPRASVLYEAAELITGDRNNQYGPPTADFKRTAGMATAFGFQVNGEPLEAHHVAIFMMLLKTSRLAWTPGKRDSWVDASGYAGCGYECAIEGEPEPAKPVSLTPIADATAQALSALRRKLAGEAA